MAGCAQAWSPTPVGEVLVDRDADVENVLCCLTNACRPSGHVFKFSFVGINGLDPPSSPSLKWEPGNDLTESPLVSTNNGISALC